MDGAAHYHINLARIANEPVPDHGAHIRVRGGNRRTAPFGAAHGNPILSAHRVFLTLATVAVLLRIPGMFSDFWLDEIWSLRLAQTITSPLQVFTEFPGSENQHLNTLLLFLIGEQASWAVYRLPAFVTGIACVLLAGYAFAPARSGERLIATGLVALSYPLVHYATEARGYAPMLMFAVLSCICARKYIETLQWRYALGLWFIVPLGFLAHLSFVHVLNGLTVWLVLGLYKRTARPTSVFFHGTTCLGIPAVSLLTFYVLVLHRFKVDGEMDFVTFDVLLKTLSYTGGGPADGPVAWIAGTLLVVVTCWGLMNLRISGRSEWSFILVAGFASPAVLYLLFEPRFLFLRYFLIGILFSLLAASSILARWLTSQHAIVRQFALLAVLAFGLGNLANIHAMTKDGRGHYVKTLRFIAARTETAVISLTSDHDFRNTMVIDFYRPFVSNDKRIDYVHRYDPATIPVQWRLEHHIGRAKPIAEEVHDQAGRRYQFVDTFPYSDLSGWHWSVYQRIEP